MTKRDYTSAPVSSALGLESVIIGLAQDIEDLRAQKISPQDAMARSAIAKQLFNGVRIYLQAMKTLETNAKPLKSLSTEQPND